MAKVKGATVVELEKPATKPVRIKTPAVKTTNVVEDAIKGDKKVNVVYETTDYDKFVFRPDNRVIRKPHVKELTNKMKSHGWVQGSHAKINSKGEVIDGQHRILAAKEAAVPFQYIVEKDAGFDEIQTLNQNQVNWNKIDHVHGWISRGNKNYKQLNDFMERHPNFNITEAVMLLMNEFASISRNSFENGDFKVKSVELADKWADNLKRLEPFFPEGYNKSMFVRAMVKLFSRKADVFDFEEFIDKIERKPGSLHLCGSTDLYIELIEEIFNFRRKTKVSLKY